jgi:hypothetical protein
MFDLISLIVISLAVPVIVIAGLKLYKVDDIGKIMAVFTIVLLVLEAIKFFYNASLYDDGITPSGEVRLNTTFFLMIVGFFATFHKGRAGQIARSTFILTCLTPIVHAIFVPSVYSSEVDVYSMISGIYFLECGVILFLGYGQMSKRQKAFDLRDCLYAVVFIAFLFLSGVLANVFWRADIEVRILWYLCWPVCLIAILPPILVDRLKHKKSVDHP